MRNQQASKLKNSEVNSNGILFTNYLLNTFCKIWPNMKPLLLQKNKPKQKNKQLPHNLHLPLVVWKCSHWRWGEISHGFGRIIWPELLFTDWKIFSEKRGCHKFKQNIYL